MNLTDSAAIQKFVSQHQQAFITLSTDYYLIYILGTVPDFPLARYRQQFGWKPGILTDILAPGNAPAILVAGPNWHSGRIF